MIVSMKLPVQMRTASICYSLDLQSFAVIYNLHCTYPQAIIINWRRIVKKKHLGGTKMLKKLFVQRKMHKRPFCRTGLHGTLSQLFLFAEWCVRKNKLLFSAKSPVDKIISSNASKITRISCYRE